MPALVVAGQSAATAISPEALLKSLMRPNEPGLGTNASCHSTEPRQAVLLASTEYTGLPACSKGSRPTVSMDPASTEAIV